MVKKRYYAVMTGTIIVLVIFALYALCKGQYMISFEELVRAFTGKQVQANVITVLFRIRLPRIIMAAAAGAGLSAAGAAFQSMFANPLATPDTLGTSNGASFGAALAILLGAGTAGIQVSALFSGLLAIALVFLVSGVSRRNVSILTVVLSGMVISSLFSALVSFVKFVADPNDVLPVITYWLMGSLSSINLKSLYTGLPLIAIGTFILYLIRYRMNVISLSKEEAVSLGVNLPVVRTVVIVSAALITASVTAMCGVISWIGLLIPHISRMLVGNDNSRVIPCSIVCGGLFLVVIDTLARTLTVSEIPVSILTSIVGAPVFILLLKKTGGVLK